MLFSIKVFVTAGVVCTAVVADGVVTAGVVFDSGVVTDGVVLFSLFSVNPSNDWIFVLNGV